MLACLLVAASRGFVVSPRFLVPDGKLNLPQSPLVSRLMSSAINASDTPSGSEGHSWPLWCVRISTSQPTEL